jgi:class 3 adenylate cyclase
VNRCPQCGHENSGDAKFCLECGRRLALRCGACGTELPAGAKFCKECGQAVSVATPPTPARVGAPPGSYTPKHLAEKILTSKTALEGERKQVTVLFADMKGSMELLTDRDPEEARKILDPVLERMMDAIHRYEGTVNQVMGDGIMALFGAPVAHEDHAIRACYAALSIQDTVNRYSDELQRLHGAPVQVRIGLNSGEVVVRSIGSDLRMDYTAVGETTHLAARMEQMTKAGSILVTASTLRMAEGYVEARSLGAVPVRGRTEPVTVYEILGATGVRSRFQATTARGLTRFVGREVELEQLGRALADATAGKGRVVALVGHAGVGKSRLVHEFTRSERTEGTLVLEGGSVSYGRATPYQPVVDLLKGYVKIPHDADHRAMRENVVARVLGLDRSLEPIVTPLLALLDVPVDDRHWQALDPPQRRRQTLDAIRQLLLRESEVQPVIVVVEDLHTIDAETQAVLDVLVNSLVAARLLLFVNYRSEYRHHWAEQPQYLELHIEPLPGPEAEALLSALVGDDPVLEPLKRLMIDKTDGNPFFLEECVRTLVETRALMPHGRGYRLARPIDAIQVPATVMPCSPRGSTACPPWRNDCSNARRSSVGTFRSRSSRRSPNCRTTTCAAASRIFRRRSSSTRRGSSPTPNTPSSMHSPMRWPTGKCCRRVASRSMPRSWTRSRSCTPTGSPSTSSGWRTMPCAASAGTRRSRICARPGRVRSAARRTGRRSPISRSR